MVLVIYILFLTIFLKEFEIIYKTESLEESFERML